MFRTHNMSVNRQEYLIVDNNGKVLTERLNGTDDEPLIFKNDNEAEIFLDKNHKNKTEGMILVLVEKVF